MKTSRRPCYCQLEIGSCFCEWDDEDFSKMVKEDLVVFNTALSNQICITSEMGFRITERRHGWIDFSS